MRIPIITDLFGILINFLHSFLGNYMLTLFVFAVLIKLLLFPLGIKQQKSMVKQAGLRPKEMAIRKKYAGRTDKVTQTKMQEEIMQLYQAEKFNPMSGCLPMLLQLPIIYALYYVITNPLEYILKVPTDLIAKFMEVAKTLDNSVFNQIGIMDQVIRQGPSGAFSDLFTSSVTYDSIVQLKDQFTLGGLNINLLEKPTFTWNLLLLVPILTFVIAFVSTKFIRKFSYQPGADTGKGSMLMMDLMMPLLSVWISFSVSAAVGIYWIYQNILSALQQYILYKMYPIPEVTPEQIKEAEMQLKGKARRRELPPASEDNHSAGTALGKAPLKENRKKRKNLSLIDRPKGVSRKAREIVKRKNAAPKARRKI